MSNKPHLPAYFRSGRLCIFLLFSLFALLCASTENGSAASLSPVKSITIEAPSELLENSITILAIDDAINLLKKSFTGAAISLNGDNAQVRIILPKIIKHERLMTSSFSKGRTYDYLNYPEHNYRWRSSRKKDIITLELRSSSYEGTAFGIYGLLQEKLGFKFYHPRRSIIPSHKAWPLPPNFDWQATPRFDKKGFHIHTQHPVELAEQLHNPGMVNALADVKEYIDWLARNQQNVFQFYLLRDIQRDQWMRHAKEIVSYAHKRGILIGVEFSLACIQQKAFQALKLLNPLQGSYRTQVDDTLAWLLQADWDFVTVDFSMGEYMLDLGVTMPELRDYVITQITTKYKTKVLYATHIIQQKDCVKLPKALQSMFSPACDGTIHIPQQAGVLIHTVMCYSIDAMKAPVYGNANQRYMLRRAAEESRIRETWYWPESSYWVSFDNSVPLLLLTYLDARWRDMNTMKRIGVDNHITFSSGWEWGYWLIDWSIARWSWVHKGKGSGKTSHPLNILFDLFTDERIENIWEEALALQDYFFNERELMPLMSALDPSAELPSPFNHPFQPRPSFTFEWLLRKSSDDYVNKVLQGPVASLIDYDQKMSHLTKMLKVESARFFSKRKHSNPQLKGLMDELTRSLQITALRARHRSLTIKALIAKREQVLKGRLTNEAEALLQRAMEVRSEAQTIVHVQEGAYRYPVELLARKRQSFTAYEFGYLYPASNLYFWWREEEQVRNTRFDAFYLNIWDFRRIIGLESLLY